MRIPSLTIDVLVAVIALARKKTCELAGEELSLGASAIHKRVRIAENLIGQRLFIGTDEGMMLTDEGRIFYPDAIRTVEQAILAEEKTKAFIDLKSRHLRVGHSTYLPPKLLAFVMEIELDKTPGASIQHIPGITPSLAQRVVDGTLHVAFGDLSVSHPALLSRQLMEEPLLVCVPKSHPLALKPSVRPQDLHEAPIIAVARESMPAQHLEIEQYFDGFGVRLKVVADAYGPPEAVSMVAHDMGISLLGASSAIGASIAAKPLTVKTLTRKIGLYVREDNRHPSIDDFIGVVLQKTANGYRRTLTSPSTARRRTSR